MPIPYMIHEDESERMTIVNTKAPYGYLDLTEDINLLRQKYNFLQSQTIGQSVLGKNITAIRLGSGPKEVHYNGAIHANEWITALLLMKFIEDYADAIADGVSLRGRNMAQLFQATTLWVVPMLNPDGVELVQEGVKPQDPFYRELLNWNNGSFNFSGWKANIRGVDLNDQFPANWEIEKNRRGVGGPAPKDYPGEAPLTEPEAIAIADFTRQHNFRLAIAFHTQGQEIYWNYRELEPPESQVIAERFAHRSGYKSIRLTESDAGYKDWFIQEFRRPGFTVEAGSGTNPLPLSQFPEIYEDVIGIMLEGLTV